MEKVTLLAGQRQKRESYKAIQACNDYLRLGPGRTLPALVQWYAKSGENPPPTRSYYTLKDWAAKYAWRERAAEYDVMREQLANERAQEIMASGLAVAHERVVKLKELAGFLEEQLYEQGENEVFHNVWLPDVKQIGSGPDAERVDIERFNAAIISEFRAALDDLAKETGGRIRKQELFGKGGGPIQHKDVSEFTDGERIARIIALLEAARARKEQAGCD